MKKRWVQSNGFHFLAGYGFWGTNAWNLLELFTMNLITPLITNNVCFERLIDCAFSSNWKTKSIYLNIHNPWVFNLNHARTHTYATHSITPHQFQTWLLNQLVMNERFISIKERVNFSSLLFNINFQLNNSQVQWNLL